MMRGIDSRNEMDPSKLLRDTRTIGQRIAEFFANPANVTVVIISIAACIYFLPQAGIICFAFAMVMFFYSYTRKQKLPFRLPQVSKAKDFNDLKPGIKTPYTARGIAFFGNEKMSNKEIWFANEDMRTHVLIFGSTGSGKTEALVSIAYTGQWFYLCRW